MPRPAPPRPEPSEPPEPSRPAGGPAPGAAPGLRSMVLPVYLPTALYATGQGAIAPVVALTAREDGASLGVAGLVVALLGVGQVAGDVPAGALAARIGERRAMILAVLLSTAALGGVLLANTVHLLAGCVVLLGCCNSVIGLARQAFVTDVVPFPLRARALSTLGGTLRVGAAVGPFVAAPVVGAQGTHAAYVVAVVAGILAAGVLLAVPEPAHLAARPSRGQAPVPVARVVREHGRVLRTLGLSAMVIGAVRASRQVVLPLWAQHLGADAAATSVVFGLSAILDMALFYPSGRVMDLRGRAAVAVPSMAVLGVAHLALPLTRSIVPLTLVALVMGIGNGMGSGVVMTLGADVSPVRGRAEFLGVWRLFHDSGLAAGPLALAGVAAVAGLAPAVLVMGGAGVLGAALLARWIPRYGRPAAQRGRMGDAAAAGGGPPAGRGHDANQGEP